VKRGILGKSSGSNALHRRSAFFSFSDHRLRHADLPGKANIQAAVLYGPGLLLFIIPGVGTLPLKTDPITRIVFQHTGQTVNFGSSDMPAFKLEGSVMHVFAELDRLKASCSPSAAMRLCKKSS